MRPALLLGFLLLVTALSGCSQDAADADASGDETVAGSETFEPVRDILLEQTYTAVGLPDPVGALFPSTFELAEGYDTLELIGQVECTGDGQVDFLDVLDVTVTGPSGDEVARFQGVGNGAVGLEVGGMSSCKNTFPIAYHWAPEAGTYGIEVTVATPTSFTLWVTGNAGQAPDFSFRFLDSEEIGHLSDYVGKVVLVDMMATWCGPCNDAMPDLVQIKQDYGDQVEILSMDLDLAETDDELRDFQDRHGATWVFGFDDGDTIRESYFTGWYPSFAIIDQHGGLLYRAVGAIAPEDCRAMIDYALENR